MQTRTLREEKQKIKCVVQHLLSLWIALGHRSVQLKQSNRFLREELHRFDQIKQLFARRVSCKTRFRVAVLSLLAMHRFRFFARHSTCLRLPSSNVSYEKNLLDVDDQFLWSLSSSDVFSSLLVQFHRLSPAASQHGSPLSRSLVQSIGSSLCPSSFSKVGLKETEEESIACLSEFR